MSCLKFSRTEAELELHKLLSKHDITIDETEFPQLNKMSWRGYNASWNNYFNNKAAAKVVDGDTVIIGKSGND